MQEQTYKYPEFFTHPEETDGLEEMLRKWETLSSNLGKYPPGAPILLPDLFVVSESVSLRSRLVRELAAYLQSVDNLMDFSGDVPYFEFMLNYCEPESEFTEIQRFIDEVRDNTGFRNVFKGIIHIHADAWTGHQEEHHFLDFMDYLAQNTGDWLLMISAGTHHPEKLGAFEAVLAMFLRIEKLELRLGSTPSLVEELEGMIRRYGFKLDMDAKELLTDSIDVLRDNRFFDAPYTLRLLCSDIVYEVYSHQLKSSRVLTADDLAGFRPESEYVQRSLKKLRESCIIGFLGSESKN